MRKRLHEMTHEESRLAAEHGTATELVVLQAILEVLRDVLAELQKR